VLVLASASPRRADALRKLGLEFVQRPSALAEAIPAGSNPAEGALRLARSKAEVVAADVAQGWVLGCDTVVWHRGRELPKPASAEDALATLQALQGEAHEVYTALCVLRMPGRVAHEHVERARVRFASIPKAALEAYVATGEPLGKAGAYAVQGIAAAYIEEVVGRVDAVIGLPVRPLVLLLAKAGYPLPGHLALAPGGSL
jgi:septum formation protein